MRELSFYPVWILKYTICQRFFYPSPYPGWSYSIHRVHNFVLMLNKLVNNTTKLNRCILKSVIFTFLTQESPREPTICPHCNKRSGQMGSLNSLRWTKNCTVRHWQSRHLADKSFLVNNELLIDLLEVSSERNNVSIKTVSTSLSPISLCQLRAMCKQNEVLYHTLFFMVCKLAQG